MRLLPFAWARALVLLLTVATTSALSTTGSRLLLVADHLAEQISYSTFLGDLQGRGFELSIVSAKNSSLSLFYLGERAYDHVIVLPSALKGLGPNLSPAALLKFLDAQGNLLLGLTSKGNVPASLIGLLAELDITLPPEKTGLVVDHFNYDAISAADAHDVLLLPPPSHRSGVSAFFGPTGSVSERHYIAFPHGVGHILGSGPLLNPLLRAPRTAYSYPHSEQASFDPDDLFAAGQQLNLVSAVQARNSARVVIVGSAEMLSDHWFEETIQTVDGHKSDTWNREFSRRISAWAFHEIGVLRVNSVEHGVGKSAATANMSSPSIYRVKNETTYQISVSEYAWDHWKPFVPPEGDEIQLEFSMLSPFHRLGLKAAKTALTNQTVFSTSFTLPDQHGIFNFLVNYKRPFLTNIEEKRTVSVRHFAHDEWPRSYDLAGAWPGITGIFSTVVGFVSFCAIWMYSRPSVTALNAKKIR